MEVAPTSAQAGPAGTTNRVSASDLRLLRELSEATSRHAGEAFLQSVVLRICDALNADVTFIGELSKGPSEAVQTVAVASDGALIDDFDYPLAGTPCENVIGKEACLYPCNVAAEFPDDPLLGEMGIQAYLGFPLFDSRQTPIGLVAALFRHPLEDPDAAEAFLRICSARIASELECMRAEHASRMSEERLRQLAETTRDVFWITDWKTKVTLFASPAYQNIWGRPLEALYSVPESWMEAIHPEDRERVCQSFQRLGEGRPYDEEYRIVRRDGSERWVRDQRFPLRGATGNVYRVTGTSEDITERKEAEAIQAQYEHIVWGATDMLALVNKNFVYLAANAAYLRAFSEEQEDVVGRTVSEVLGENLFETVIKPNALRCLGGESVRYQQWFDFPAVGRRCMDVAYSPHRGGGAGIVGFVVTARDITDLMLTEERLRQSEEKYRSLFEGSRDAIMTLGPPSWDLTAGNPAMIDMFKAPDEADFVSRPPWEYSPEFQPDGHASAGKAKEMIETAMREGSHFFEWTHRRRTGEDFPATVLLTKIQVAGEPMLQATVRDITELKRAAAEKAQLEERYRHSQKMEAIGRLGGGIAHDFNNLLTVINSCAEFALEGLRDGDPMKVDLQHIADAGQRAATLTAQLLAFSRKQVLQPQVLDLNAVVADLEPMLKRLLGEDIDLCTKQAPDLGWVKADRGQIDQVLMNLAVNARDAMPRGGELTIETSNADVDSDDANAEPCAAAAQGVVLAVTDTGSGMSAEEVEHIFEPFYTTKPTGQGTGLGLATVYGIVMQSGGNVSVESAPGRGTTIRVQLPRIEKAAPEPRPPPDLATLRGTETILLVEDEPAVRALTSRILSGAGYDVIAAANGGEALLECEERESKIHLVLTDVVMPKMNGKELVDRLTALRPPVKALYMSGYTGHAIASHGILNEDTHFIAKPFEPTALLKQIRTVLDGG